MAQKVLQPDVLNALCPAQQVLELLADKWSVLVIFFLTQGTQRYTDMQHQIGGISQKMLTQTLRRLERDGLVKRTVYPVVPPKVEYSLTPLGRTLEPSLRLLCEWAQDHLFEVLMARAGHGGEKQTPFGPDLRPQHSKGPNGERPGVKARSAAASFSGQALPYHRSK